MKFNYVILAFVLVMLIGVASAEQQTLGTFKQGECIVLKQTCANCTFVNVTSVLSPTTVNLLDNNIMTKVGTEYNYTFCNTTTLGQYIYNTLGDPDGILTTQPVSFTVTPSGSENINSGQGMTLIGSLVVIIIIGILFFIIGNSLQSTGKIIFFTLAVIMLVIAILFSLVGLQQNLGGFSNIIESYSSAWFIIKILLSLFVLVLVLFSGYLAFKLWMRKRGFID